MSGKIDFAGISTVFELDLNKIEMYSKLLDRTLQSKYTAWELAQCLNGLKTWVNELETDTNGYVSMLKEYYKGAEDLLNKEIG